MYIHMYVYPDWVQGWGHMPIVDQSLLTIADRLIITITGTYFASTKQVLQHFPTTWILTWHPFLKVTQIDSKCQSSMSKWWKYVFLHKKHMERHMVFPSYLTCPSYLIWVAVCTVCEKMLHFFIFTVFRNILMQMVGLVSLLPHPTPRIPNSYYYCSCCSSQKASSGDISGTECGIIDLLVSKRPENILNKKI